MEWLGSKETKTHMRDHKADSRVYFDELAPNYDRHYYGRHGRQQYQRVLAVASAWEYTSILDVGCGAGGLLSLMRRPRIRLAGADLSPGMIQEAKKRLEKATDLRVADAEHLPWKAGSFDLVVTTDSIHHWPNPTKAFAEIKRVLKKGGHLIIADVWAPSPFRHLGNVLARFSREGDVRVYSEDELTRLLKEAGFASIRRAHLSFMAIVMHAEVRT